MILVSNDDGIFAPGLSALAAELKNVDSVIAVAPDREQSATGTSVTLREPLRVRRVDSIAPEVPTFAVEGTPSDSVILALGKLAARAGVVVSGVNSGQNLAALQFLKTLFDDHCAWLSTEPNPLDSGTVGAALQGYLRNLPSIAVSIERSDTTNLQPAARLVRLLVQKIRDGGLPSDIFLNVNLPPEPLDAIRGIVVTQPAHKTHIDTVEEGNDGRRDYFWLVRRQLEHRSSDSSDIWAVEHGYISITPLHTTLFRRPAPDIDATFCDGLFCALKA